MHNSAWSFFCFFSVCPGNVQIYEGNKQLTCSADNATVYYKWTDNIGGNVSYGETYPLHGAYYNITCTAHFTGYGIRYSFPQDVIHLSDPGFSCNKSNGTMWNDTVDCVLSKTVVGCKYFWFIPHFFDALLPRQRKLFLFSRSWV